MARQGSAMEVTNQNQYLKVLLVGGPGSGKSIFAASCPTPGYVFDVDGGILSYRGTDFEYGQYTMDGAGFQDFVKELKEVSEETKNGKYNTIVLDSATTLMDLAMQQALRLDPKRSPTGGPIWNVHYSMVKNMVEGAIKAIISLPANIVVICHKDIVKDESSGSIIAIEPLLTGTLSKRIPGLFDEVYYASVRGAQGNNQWVLQTVPRGLIEARSRISGKEHILPDYIPNEYSAVMHYIRANQSQLAKKA